MRSLVPPMCPCGRSPIPENTGCAASMIRTTITPCVGDSQHVVCARSCFFTTDPRNRAFGFDVGLDYYDDVFRRRARTVVFGGLEISAAFVVYLLFLARIRPKYYYNDVWRNAETRGVIDDATVVNWDGTTMHSWQTRYVGDASDARSKHSKHANAKFTLQYCVPRSSAWTKRNVGSS